MKKALRMKRVHGKKSNIGKRNRSRVFSMVIFIMVLSSFFQMWTACKFRRQGRMRMLSSVRSQGTPMLQRA